MLTNLKLWLETTGMKAADTLFKIPPALPYIIFKDDANHRGADASNPLAERSVTVELYDNTSNMVAEGLIEALFDSKVYAYTKHREWISSESFFMTVYEFETTERK